MSLPPGVFMTNTSLACTRVWSFPSSLSIVPSLHRTEFSPGSPGWPPFEPNETVSRCDDRTVTVIGSRNRSLRTMP